MRDIKANLRPIGLLAIGLVLFTTLVVGVVAGLLVEGLRWAPAFALGAIVAPPDAVSATSVLRRLGVPRRVVTILEGESLVDDASALIAYRVAVAAVLTGSFSALDAGVSFVVVGVGGIAVGVVVGLLVTGAWRRTGDPTLEIILSLIAPIAAYLSAEAIGASGVLATVTAGLIAGRRAARALSPDGRLLGTGVWAVLYFLIDSFLFMLIGLQLPYVVEGLSAYTTGELIALGVAISLTVIVARIVWVFPATYLPRVLSARIRERDPSPPRAAVVVIAWAGMRGAVSLAAALALPIEPTPFPERNLIIFLTFCVILATLVGQGLTLPWVIGRLGLVAGTGTNVRRPGAPGGDRRRARPARGPRAWNTPTTCARRPAPCQRRARGGPRVAGGDADIDEADRERVDHQAIRLSVVEAQREAVIRLRDDGVIGDDALRRVERDLDLEALRSGV